MTIKKRINWQFKPSLQLTLCSFLLLFILSNAPLWAKSSPPILPNASHSAQCKEIIQALQKLHYLEKKIDNQLSTVILDRYIKRLDPGKMLFTTQDIKQFNAHKTTLDNDIKKGDMKSAFTMFNRYLTRSTQQLEYILSLIKIWEKNFDFAKDETLIIDPDDMKRATRQDELYPLWKKALKNHIITMRLEGQEDNDITERLEKIYSNRLQRLKQTESDDIFQVFMNSVTSSFDPHTQFFPPRASEDFDIHMSLSLEGIGAVLQTEYEYTKVVRLIPKGPADKSKLLMPGDKIIGVGQGITGEIKDTIGQRIDHVVKLIRGPKNSFVRLKIIPAKQSDETKTIQIKRDRVKLEEQSAQKSIITIDHNNQKFKIGMIEIPNFYIDFNAQRRGDPDYKSTTRDVKRLIDELKAENIDGLIIDLRDNGGGSLDEANDLTGLFIKSGPTVQIRHKHNKVQRYYDSDPTISYTGPLVVLINRMSASASEIFAGAVKDYNRGVVVGSRSFGKATVQELRSLSKGRLKLTRAKFYRVSGNSTQHIGVVPDLNYPQLYKVEDTGESSLEGALPRDTISRTSYRAYPALDAVFEKLNDTYKRRALTDPGVNYLNSKIDLTSKINFQKTLSLNIETRKFRKEKNQQLTLDIENTYRKAIGINPIKNLDQNEEDQIDNKKILMDQTHLVMADFIRLSRSLGYKW